MASFIVFVGWLGMSDPRIYYILGFSVMLVSALLTLALAYYERRRLGRMGWGRYLVYAVAIGMFVLFLPVLFP